MNKIFTLLAILAFASCNDKEAVEYVDGKQRLNFNDKDVNGDPISVELVNHGVDIVVQGKELIFKITTSDKDYKIVNAIFDCPVANCSKGQNRVFIGKVDPSENLAKTIEELSYSQQECDYYTSSLIYLVREVSGSDSFKVSFTMIEGLEFLPKQMLGDITGYFESDGKTVLLMGEKLKKLYSNLQSKKEFIYDEDFEVYPSDYSLWMYELKDDQLIELNSFKISCE